MTKKYTFTLFFCCCITGFCLAQNNFKSRHTYWKSQGKEQLIEAKYYEKGKMYRSATFDKKDGRQLTSTDYDYNQQGLLKRKITNHDGKWDVVQHFTYNTDGSLQHVLFGNNRTGVWGSKSYHYNSKGDIEEVNYFRKNGNPFYTEKIKHQYNNQDSILEEYRYREYPDKDQVDFVYKIKNEYQNGELVKTLYLDYQDKIDYGIVFKYYNHGKKKQETYLNKGGAISSYVVYEYPDSNTIREKSYTSSNQVSSTKTSRRQGKNKAYERLQYANGQMEEYRFEYKQ